jgi:hypothetical protein
MKTRPTKIQPGATLWNPNAGPDWYAKSLAGQWMYFDAEEGDWDNGQWVLSIGVNLSDLIPVEHLMAQEVGGTVKDGGPQPPEWNGEGLPPFGVDCKITTRTILGTDEYEGIGMFIAQTMDYYVMLMQIDRTPWVRSKDRVTFRPIKTEREKAIDDIKSLITKSCGLTEHRIQIIATALFDAGYRKVEK